MDTQLSEQAPPGTSWEVLRADLMALADLLDAHREVAEAFAFADHIEQVRAYRALLPSSFRYLTHLVDNELVPDAPSGAVTHG